MAQAIDRERLRGLLRAEEERFVAQHPRSRELFEQGRRSLLAGVPMPWMTEWAGPFPVFAAEAQGAHFTDVDGNGYVDFCLGDTGAMAGHSPPAAAEAIAAQAARGVTLMLPTEDSAWVGEELGRRFGLPYWQFALTATDANRFTIRLARAITSRPKVLVYAWCYHGTVDETFAIAVDGETRSRPDNVGPPVDLDVTTKAIEWNDVEALDAALAEGDVACVLAEPAMTNVGIILPEPGYHEALRALTREHGTLLTIDETHTISAGPGGYTRAHGLEPDLVTLGKPIAAGVPAAAYGMSQEVADRVAGVPGDTGGERRRGDRRHAVGQRAVAGGDPSDARSRADGGGLRADDRPRSPLRGRRHRRDRRARGTVARDPARLPRGVRLSRHPAAQRLGGRGDGRS